MRNATTWVVDEVAAPTSEPAATAAAGRRPAPWPRRGRLYNVSNFGDTNACYANVDRGDDRVFFLTLFNDRLSAKYDDLFGAVADRTTDNEDEILDALGRLIISHSSCLLSAFSHLSPSSSSSSAVVQLVEYRTRSREVAGSTHTRSTASNLEQVANLLCAQANSASYPQRDGK